MPGLIFLTRGAQTPRFRQPGQRRLRYQLQRICRAVFNTGRAVFAIQTQITFVRRGFDLILTCWRKDYLHCAEGTGNHAGFTADTFLLVDLNAVFDMTDCAIWATPGARRILAVVAGYRAALMLMFDHRNSGLKMPLVQYVLLIIVGHYASDLTGMASQALLAIGHNKTIHGVLLFWWQKPYSLYECY
ncbi:hypothetical protein CKO_00324 [Citrobacter koseri ATCC BAA-895]|uniref:Uncharacterized protein n=1 Tax=Citrobacter koseri (strain ATCC BAA-895 / CDC 4225-83 / SGSC4696) TaxID=290338 RepID=A8ADC4_CITK8|nr:hypothetical protein CKO_00324 [Citrobacter koseri ATCC BAA-895]